MTTVTLDLSDIGNEFGFVITGVNSGDVTGYVVSSAGDVNNDGIDDMIIGAHDADLGGVSSGAAYVVYGQAGMQGTIDLATLSAAQGYVIQGAASGDYSGFSVSAGDMNGDGISDLMVSAFQADTGGPDAGGAYVIYGHSGTQGLLDLTQLQPSQGYFIAGSSPSVWVGYEVSFAGDVNGDGIGDMILGDQNTSGYGIPSNGRAYVVFGTADGRTALDLGALAATDGYQIMGAGGNAGTTVSGAGDFNNDGIGDLLVGTNSLDNAYVVFGTSGIGTNVNLATMTSAQGIVFSGAGGTLTGRNVSAAGDVNGDGIADVLIGAPDDGNVGAAYVVYGHDGPQGNLDLTTMTQTQGFKLIGEASVDFAGWAVSDAGDVNGDGIDDFIIGALHADQGGGDSGEAYLIYGKLGARDDISLTTLSDLDGFKIQGDAAGDQAGWDVSGAGDINADGYDDLLVGAPHNGTGGADTGSAYVIYGGPGGGFTPPGVLITGTDRVTSESGDGAAVSVRLTVAPVSTVTLRFLVSDATEGSLTETTLTFDATNWSIPQTLSFVGVDDQLDDGNVMYTVSVTVETTDPAYTNVVVPQITLTNLDDQTDKPLRLYGTDADNVLTGGAFDDRLYAKGGLDDLFGGGGNDRLYGQEDDDRAYGGDGADLVYGGYDDDRLYGGTGNDQLFGDDGFDLLQGGTGDDVLNGGTSADTMNGGAGNDTYYVDDQLDVIVDGGAATDVDTVVLLTSVVYTLSTNVEDAALDNASGNSGLVGNGLDNTLTGNAGANDLSGGAGNDQLTGGAGADTLYAADGNDSVDAGDGNDVIIGGDGAGDDTYLGGSGIDTVIYTSALAGITVNLATGRAGSVGGGDAARIGRDRLIDVENITAGNFNDVLSGNSAANAISGGAGGDLISGAGGNDWLNGGVGNDTLNGGQSTDVLIGGKGADTFAFAFDSGRDSIRDFQDNVDRIQFTGLAADFGDLTIVTQGRGALVSIGGVFVTVANILPAQLDAGDFLFS